MVIQNKTILVAGGSSGIGLQTAKVLVSKQNKVIICGRSNKKLEEAKALIPELITYECDISELKNCKKLATWIASKHPKCSVLINNAAIVHKTDFFEDDEMLAKADLEIRTNLMAPVHLCKHFLPILARHPHGKIINITTGLVYSPKASYPIYNAAKAALRSFTHVLRMQTKHLPIAIIEVLFPVVDTPWHRGNVPTTAISSEKAVEEMIRKLEKGQTEIKIGKVKLLYYVSRLAPILASKIINSL